MANCTEGGVETDLHELGAPICPACVTERERLHPVQKTLSADLALARALYCEAMEEFERCKAALQALKLCDETLRTHGKDGELSSV